MGLFSRFLGAAQIHQQPQSTVQSPSITAAPASLRSRNAFLHFLKEYRQNYQVSINTPIWRVTMEAANHWNRMTLRDKFSYIEAAHHATYVYRTRDRRMNRIMHLMRKALLDENQINLLYLKSAVKQMQLWKRKTLNGI